MDAPLVPMPVVKVGKRGSRVETVEQSGTVTVKGEGTAFADTVIEQDAAYWEVKVIDVGGTYRVGVAKDGMNLEAQIGDNQSSWGLSSTSTPMQEGDVIGVAFGQDDLPNLRFFVNGNSIDTASVMRVRGEVYPALSVAGSAALAFVFKPEHFAHIPAGRHTEIRPARRML